VREDGPDRQAVRQLSSEPIPDPSSPGLTLRQIDDAMNRYGVDLEVQYRLPWDDFARKIDKGEGAVLQGATGPFVGTKYQATAGDINHGIFVPPGWGAMDPCADGRRNDVWKYDGSPYPKDLLRRFAGHLMLGSSGSRLGIGYVYAAFTRDRRSTWTWQHGPGKFVLWRADDLARTCKPIKTQRTGGTRAARLHPAAAVHGEGRHVPLAGPDARRRVRRRLRREPLRTRGAVMDDVEPTEDELLAEEPGEPEPKDDPVPEPEEEPKP
jgi:hypothetical protein